MATSVVETITPAKAQEYLNMSGGNRNISKAVVNSYAITMKSGKWLLNGEAIVFDLDGVLLNGHHRLHAVIKAGVPIQSFVTRGVEHESYTTFDCGRHRTVGQLIGMQGIKNYNAVASAVQLSYRLTNGYSLGETNSSKHLGKTNSDLIAYFNTDIELFIEAGAFSTQIRCECPILDQSIVGGTFHYLVRVCGYQNETVKDFFSMVCSYSTCENQSLDTLRLRLLKNRGSKIERLSRTVLYAFVIKTWNAYVTGRTITCLRYNPEKEKYPTFIKAYELNNKNQ